MSVLYDDNIVAFGGNDFAINHGYYNYRSLHDEESIALKRCFFCILIHGYADSVQSEGTNWSPKDLIDKASVYYRNLGKNRAILLLSCFTAYGVAKQVAMNFHVPVIAPKAAASINDVGQILTVDVDDNIRTQNGRVNMPDDKRWMFFSTSGNISDVSPYPVLDKSKAVKLASRQMFIFG